MSPYELPDKWHCFAVMEALRMYPQVKAAWDLPSAGQAYLPTNSKGTWHVTSLCPASMWSSTTGTLVEVEEALQNLCHHCQALLTTSAGIASLQGDGVWWDASPLSESLLVSLLFALSHPESKAAHSMFGWITQEARHAAYLSSERNRGGCPALSAALRKSAEHRESLLSEVGVCVSLELDTSLFAPILSVPGGHLLLSDGARILGENVLLTNASYNPVSERGPMKMQILPFSDASTADLFGALSVAGLPAEEASQAALLLCK
jgi:hypothetical protein